MGGASISAAGLLVSPESPSLEIGSNFTATCVIVDAEDLRAEDLYWTLSRNTIPEQHYTKINRTAISVTITVAGEKEEWLYCRSQTPSKHSWDFLVHAILLKRACRILFFLLLLLSLQTPPGVESGVTCVCVCVRPSREAGEFVVRGAPGIVPAFLHQLSVGPQRAPGCRRSHHIHAQR